MSRLRLLIADPKTLQADQLVAEARQALAAGRRQAARRWLWGALAADPENVHAWLMLATLSSPEASLAYVSRALELRPHNPVAQRALEWAQRRLEQEARPKAEAPSGAAAVTLLRIPAVEKAEEELLPLEAVAAETLLHAPDLDATVAQVELEGGASAPEAGAVTLLHTPALEEARPEAAAAETLLHAPDLEGTIAEVALAEQAAEPSLATEKPPPSEASAETLLHAPDLEGTIAEVELEGEGAEPGAAAEAPGQAPPQSLEVTVAEVDLPSLRVEKPPAGKAAADEGAEVEGTAPHRAVSGEEEDVSSTAPRKAVRLDGPAGRAARTLIGIVAIALIGLAAATVGDRLAGPARPAAIAAAPLEYFQKSTDAPFPTDTPTVTPSPTITPTFTPTPSITPTPPASPTPAPFEAWAGGGQARWIDVNLSRQMLTAMQGETPVQSFLVSTGLWNTPTVTGDFHIYVKYPAADMSGPGYYLPLVPYVMYFYKDYGIHGTYWHNNFGNPMSHGCVNMRTDQAGWLFDWASIGTLVHVHY